MRILVTGGSGFIGRNIVGSAKNAGFTVYTYDIADSPVNSDRHFKENVLDYPALSKACDEIDAIFHLAAVTSPPQFEDLNSIGYETNVLGTYNVLRAAASKNVKRVVLASSSAVYGDVKTQVSESMAPGTLPNLYGVSKFTNELTARSFAFSGLVETVCLRYFNTFGIGENTKGAYSSVISKFVSDLHNERTATIFGDGNQQRDFIYVADLAIASLLALQRGQSGESYNIGTGITTDFNSIYNVVREEVGSKAEPKYIENPFKSYQLFTQANIDKLRGIGFAPRYNLRAGIRKMIDSPDVS